MPRKSEFAAAATLVGKDQLSKPWKKALKSAERQAGRTFSKMERAGLRTTRILNKGFKATGKGVRAIGKAGRFAGRTMKGMALATGGVVVGAAAAVDQFGKYELAVARLGNVLGTKGTDIVDEYGGALKGLGVELGVGPLEVAEAAYQALSGTTIRAKDELLGFLRAAGQASVAGGTDMATAVKAAAGVMEVFGDEAGDVNEIFNKLFVTEREGVTTFGDLAANLGDVTAFAKAMGLSFEEILGPVASLTKTGLSTSASMTQLTAIIGGVTNATGKQKKAFKDFDIPFGPDAIQKAGGFVKLLEKIGDASRKDKGAFQKLFGRKEAIKGTARLAQSGLESLRTTMSGFKTETTVFQDNFANMEKRTGFRIRQLKSGFSGLIGELGGGLAEGLGIAETSTEKIGGSFLSAGKALRSGAKNFAQGFIGALIPGEKLADINWDQVAKDGGAAFGGFITTLGGLATSFISFVKTITEGVSAVAEFGKAALAGDAVKDVAAEREAELGLQTFQTAADFDADPAAAIGRFFNQQATTGREAALTLQRATGAARSGEFIETNPALLLAEIEKRSGISPGDFSRHRDFSFTPNKKTLKKLSGATPAGAGAAGADVSGKIEISVGDKRTGGGSGVDVKATSKNPNVKMPAPKVGKRKVAGG